MVTQAHACTLGCLALGEDGGGGGGVNFVQCSVIRQGTSNAYVPGHATRKH